MPVARVGWLRVGRQCPHLRPHVRRQCHVLILHNDSEQRRRKSEPDTGLPDDRDESENNKLLDCVKAREEEEKEEERFSRVRPHTNSISQKRYKTNVKSNFCTTTLTTTTTTFLWRSVMMCLKRRWRRRKCFIRPQYSTKFLLLYVWDYIQLIKISRPIFGYSLYFLPSFPFPPPSLSGQKVGARVRTAKTIANGSIFCWLFVLKFGRAQNTLLTTLHTAYMCLI